MFQEEVGLSRAIMSRRTAIMNEVSEVGRRLAVEYEVSGYSCYIYHSLRKLILGEPSVLLYVELKL